MQVETSIQLQVDADPVISGPGRVAYIVQWQECSALYLLLGIFC